MKRRIASSVLGAGAALLGIVLACGNNPRTVAQFECVISEAGASPHPCAADQFCATSTCGATVGTCEPLGDSDGCAATGQECGCDGISYYNACARQRAGVSKRSDEECPPSIAKKCFDKLDCQAPNASCATIIPSITLPSLFPADGGFPGFPPDAGFPIGFADAGFELPDGGRPTQDLSKVIAYCQGLVNIFAPQRVCWVAPDDCPQTSAPLVTGCDQIGKSQACIDECTAIKNEGVYFACSSTDAGP